MDDPYSSGEEAYDRTIIDEGRGFFRDGEGESLDHRDDWRKIDRSSKKRRRAASSSPTVTQNPTKEETNYMVTVKATEEGKNICSLNPVKIVEEINKTIGEIKKIKKVNGTILITCSDKDQMTRALQITELVGLPITITQCQTKTKTCKGVIHNVDTTIPEEDLYHLLKEQNVGYVKRFLKRTNGILAPTPSVLLTFNSENKPTNVNFLYESYRVDSYNPPVVRCHKCQLFGHVQKYCKKEIRCVRCGDKHTFEQCTKKEEPKCFRCNLNHSAAYKGCTFYKTAQSIQTIKIKKQLTYAQATQEFKRHPIPVPSQTNKQPFTQINSQSKHNATTSDKPQQAQKTSNPQTDFPQPNFKSTPTQGNIPIPAKKAQLPQPDKTENQQFQFNSTDFLSFIVFIINNLEKETSHSNRIRLVVDAAKHCLNIQNIEAESLHQRFN